MARLRGVSEEEEEEDAPPPLPTAAAEATPTAFFVIDLVKGGLCAVRAAAMLVVLMLETRKPCFVREDAISTHSRRCSRQDEWRKVL